VGGGRRLLHLHESLATVGHMYIGRSRAKQSLNDRTRTPLRSRAQRIVDRVRALAERLGEESADCLDSEWAEEGLLEELFTTECADILMVAAKMATKLLSMQPTVVESSAPCRVFGDIHGQLRDVLMFFRAYGAPWDEDAPSFVFNGDFVDRGKHQLEVIGVLFALKVAYPHRVWLVRGNHEDRAINAKYGFEEACLEQFGAQLGAKAFDYFQDAFSQLPIACLVAGRVLCVHGGIGCGKWALNDLRALRRPLSGETLMSKELRWVRNILWSDPIEDDTKELGPGAAAVAGLHTGHRGSAHSGSVLFGWDVTKIFCARNGLDMIVRSHQTKDEGLGFDVMHGGQLMRVFTARDYEGAGNDGAVLLITSQGDDPCSQELSVRAQVLRSVRKARVEASPAARQATSK